MRRRAALRLAEQVASVNWHAVRLYRVSQRLWQADHPAAAHCIAAANRMLTGVEIPPSVQFGDGLVIMHGHGIVIHADTRVGTDCAIYQQVTIGNRGGSEPPPTLGDGVTLYPGAKVLGEIHIGDGASIGANAVVIDDVPSGAVVVAQAPRVILRSS
jgi:serine O-acetyltransferase